MVLTAKVLVTGGAGFIGSNMREMGFEYVGVGR
jgi:nucleoside-diphosphate-sugar epimerase